VIRGAYAVVGAGVRLVGGAAGDDLAMRETHQLHGEDVLTGAVVWRSALTPRSGSASATGGARSASRTS